jgi:hypothetical protein
VVVVSENLETYNAATAGLDNEALRRFDAFLIGWLIGEADPERLAEVLRHAERFATGGLS